MNRPDVVFVMSDDHAAHAISAYGSKVNRTPHLDRLARDGDADGRDLLHELDLLARRGRRS